MMTVDPNVDKLLMMWKTGGEVNFYVEICGKSFVFALFLRTFQQYVGMMWKSLCYFFFNNGLNPETVKKNRPQITQITQIFLFFF
jgi:hypothetical protein